MVIGSTGIPSCVDEKKKVSGWDAISDDIISYDMI